MVQVGEERTRWDTHFDKKLDDGETVENCQTRKNHGGLGLEITFVSVRRVLWWLASISIASAILANVFSSSPALQGPAPLPETNTPPQ